MQYLLKITLKDTPVWRLVAVDGTADIAFVAELIAASFDYEKARRVFTVNGVEYRAGNGGEVEDIKELSLFDELHLEQGQSCMYRHNINNDLIHIVEVMKKEDHLFCLMPSTLVGSGLLPKDLPFDLEHINAHFDKDDIDSLDLRECTKRMRALGVQRKDLKESLLRLGSRDLSVKINC